MDSGEVLDYHVISKSCQKCSLKNSKCKIDEEFEEWEIEHVFSGECDINFDGSSPATEVEGAKILWNRSLDLHNICYRWMVSDGDSKAHNAVEDTYEGIKVEKLIHNNFLISFPVLLINVIKQCFTVRRSKGQILNIANIHLAICCIYYFTCISSLELNYNISCCAKLRI